MCDLYILYTYNNYSNIIKIEIIEVTLAPTGSFVMITIIIDLPGVDKVDPGVILYERQGATGWVNVPPRQDVYLGIMQNTISGERVMYIEVYENKSSNASLMIKFYNY